VAHQDYARSEYPGEAGSLEAEAEAMRNITRAFASTTYDETTGPLCSRHCLSSTAWWRWWWWRQRRRWGGAAATAGDGKYVDSGLYM